MSEPRPVSQFLPDFFHEVKSIRMHDALAVQLGAVAPEQALIYSYGDAVKTAGHSCLAISGAYRLSQIAMQKLYTDALPERGEIEVVFSGAVDHKVNGPISQIVTLITGAAADNGFHGFGDGRFKRQGLMRFDNENQPPAGAIASLRFKRLDTGQSLTMTYFNHMLPEGVDLQERVRMVLLDDIEGMFVSGPQ